MSLINPHGGKLRYLVVDSDASAVLKQKAKSLPSWTLNDRQVCDLEMILNGGFSPLTGFLSEGDYITVLDNMRLQDGTLWPIPITLDVTKEFSLNIDVSQEIVLKDKEGFIIAVMSVESIWRPDKMEEANKVLLTTDEGHPAVNYLLNESNPIYVGGPVKGLMLPTQYDYKDLRHTPHHVRELFEKNSWDNVVAFQTRNPMHRAHVELTKLAAEEHDAKILIHPVVGLTKPGDVDHFTRVRCYNYILKNHLMKIYSGQNKHWFLLHNLIEK